MSARKPVKLTPYFTAADAEQIRAAFEAAGVAEGYGSLSEMIEAAALREVRRLQQKYNQGRPWDPLPAGSVRRGQRTAAEMDAHARRGEPPGRRG